METVFAAPSSISSSHLPITLASAVRCQIYQYLQQQNFVKNHENIHFENDILIIGINKT